MRLRLDSDRLTAMALAALEEVAARCRHAPQSRTRSLALVLAFLASRARDDAARHSFDLFWRSVATAYGITRCATVNSAINGIYLAVGLQRPSTSFFEGEAQRSLGEIDGMSRTAITPAAQPRR